MKFVITTTQSVNDVSDALALFINETGLLYVPRQRSSLQRIAVQHEALGIIVWESERPVLYIDNEKLFFHPSMAKCRIAAYRKKSQDDIMIKACQLAREDSFLDCTLGMGADAIVAAYFSESGRITGLESQPVVAAVIGWGMKMYQGNMPWLNQAIKRIEVINSNHKDYLSQQADRSYDVVYFDPMFQRPQLKSQPISPLRKLANHAPLDIKTIQDACRVARKCVVMKTWGGGEEMVKLGFQKVRGSQHNPIIYGVIKL
ncbi:MAG: class I SAM-dependent methyltransferase [Syntrophomonas sp.]